jgi:type I restriction enzyme R subunit
MFVNIPYNIYTELLKTVSAAGGKSKTESYEDEVKRLFIERPATMRLLIVVDKLLTGFDAPSCTYLYIDKSMHQAICRTNRLDGNDKQFGCIVDYKDLFKKLVNEKGTGALQVYSSELDNSLGGASPEVMIQDRLTKGRQRLEHARESLSLLCEPVPPPQGELEYITYFCGNPEIPEDLAAHEPQRAALYKMAAALLRAYANVADDLTAAGYSDEEIAALKREADGTVKIRDLIRQASGEYLDLKAYEADMRHLIDTYIEAGAPRPISSFGDMGMLEFLASRGLDALIAELPAGVRGNKSAVAETIANNVRKRILKERLNDPAFYERMSALLSEIIADLREKRLDYEEFLKKIVEIAGKVQTGKFGDAPKRIDTPGKQALYNNLDQNLELAIAIDAKVKEVHPADWRDNPRRENVIKKALLPLLGNDTSEVERVFKIIAAQKEY